MKLYLLFVLVFLGSNVVGSTLYIAEVDLNLRRGVGENFESLTVLDKGDTVILVEDLGGGWIKVQEKDKVGYSLKKFLRKVEVSPELGSEEDGEAEGVLIFLVVLIGAAIVLYQKGKKYRDKSTAIVLSFFLGGLGLQKFYIGEKKKGVYSIVFCWTMIPAVIGLIDFIRLAIMKDEKFNRLYNADENSNAGKQSVHPITGSTSPKKTDDSRTIIDVVSEGYDLTVEKIASHIGGGEDPPDWSHSYVYSYDEIKYASKAQKQYYQHFKSKVIKEEFVDIQGNSNYAFILYFDFLNEYQNHRDIQLLDKQFVLLGEICPKTRSYSLRSLQDELRKRKDSYSVDKLKDLEEPFFQFENGYADYNPDLFKLGNRYKDKLELDKQEIRWLNKFYNPSNVFLSIEGCCIATVLQYVKLLKKLDKHLKGNNSTLVKEVTYFKEELKKIYVKQNSEFEYYDDTYSKDRAESDVYLTMFKRVENSVRDYCGHKRKLSDDFPSVDKNLSEEFDSGFGKLVGHFTDELQDSIGELSLETKIELNTQNVNRWKGAFEILKNNFKVGELQQFVTSIVVLEETNQKNPNIENIFFDSSRFIAKYDKIQSLKYYAKYIFYDLKSKKIDNKSLAKTVQKSLFQTDEQIESFKKIISSLIQTGDIEVALEEIPKIYLVKRRKIQLDQSKIHEVEQKHEGTVELLNEYLVDENKEIPSAKNDTTEREVAVVLVENSNSIYNSKIILEQVQKDLLKLIADNAFEILQDAVDKYATQNGMFKNQLIDGINEACEELLEGEVLIEEDEDHYVIEESYYKEILK